MNSLIIALGSNIEPKEKFLRDAISRLKKEFSLIKCSHVYESEPVDYLKQDNFLNMVAQFQTPNFGPEETLVSLQNIEKDMDRVKEIDKGPRNIDLDILFFGDAEVNTQKLTIPHPSWYQRNFVVFPLLDLNLTADLRLKVEPFSKELTPPTRTNLNIS
jgi:2-amino-4-hydroxy-6-hydroxymethyldihydropteridine diphosphokinase